MRRSIAQLLLGTLTLLVPVLATSTASAANIDACGNIDVSASATCTVEYEGGCTAKCTPIAFEASCAAELTVLCDGMCNASFSATCTASCQGSCEAQCTGDPGSFSCEGACDADCGVDCSGQCSSSGNRSECEASCKATCSAECQGSCEANPPMADCTAQCNGCCEGSCTAEANMDCQVSCQAEGYVDCKASLQGGCEVACESPDGALFCDGQYVDAGGNLAECIAALQALLNIEVTFNASAECSGNTCEAKADASCGNTVAGAPVKTGGLAGLAAGLGLIALARRRRRS